MQAIQRQRFEPGNHLDCSTSELASHGGIDPTRWSIFEDVPERLERIVELLGLRASRKWTRQEVEELDRLAPTSLELRACRESLEGIKAIDPPCASPPHIDSGVHRPIAPKNGIEFITWKEERTLAGLQSGDWLIKDRLEFGAVSMLAAAPKGGKSTLVMALLAAIAKGTDFFGMPVQRVPVLNIDPENRPRFRVERFDRASGFEDGEADKYYLRPRNIPDPLTTDYLERAIRAASDQTGFSKGLVIIDTLRSAFIGDGQFNEKDANSMGRLLGKLRKCAERTGWAFLILHHTAKKTNSFYGSVAIAGAIDYIWTMTHDDRSKTSTLSIKGRGDVVEDMQFVYDIATQRLELAAKPEAERSVETQETLDLLRQFPWEQEEAKTTCQFREALEAADKGNFSKSFAESRVRKLSGSGWLDRVGAGTKSSPHRYWVSDQGKKYLATAGEVVSSEDTADGHHDVDR